jgi:hypothetical protein
LVYRELQNKFVKIRQMNILAVFMPKSLNVNARNQPTNPPFSSGLPLYKGEERWWVGWVQPNINPPHEIMPPSRV